MNSYGALLAEKWMGNWYICYQMPLEEMSQNAIPIITLYCVACTAVYASNTTSTCFILVRCTPTPGNIVRDFLFLLRGGGWRLFMHVKIVNSIKKTLGSEKKNL